MTLSSKPCLHERLTFLFCATSQTSLGSFTGKREQHTIHLVYKLEMTAFCRTSICLFYSRQADDYWNDHRVEWGCSVQDVCRILQSTKHIGKLKLYSSHSNRIANPQRPHTKSFPYTGASQEIRSLSKCYFFSSIQFSKMKLVLINNT